MVALYRGQKIIENTWIHKLFLNKPILIKLTVHKCLHLCCHKAVIITYEYLLVFVCVKFMLQLSRFKQQEFANICSNYYPLIRNPGMAWIVLGLWLLWGKLLFEVAFCVTKDLQNATTNNTEKGVVLWIEWYLEYYIVYIVVNFNIIIIYIYIYI